MYNRACEEYNLLPSCLDYIHFSSILCSFLLLLFGMFLLYKLLRGTSIKHDMKVGVLLSILYNENYIHFFSFYFILLKYILYYEIHSILFNFFSVIFHTTERLGLKNSLPPPIFLFDCRHGIVTGGSRAED